jgi:hypothetical protein
MPTTGTKEAMAVLVVFRKQRDAAGGNDPLSHALVETIAPVLGEKIQQALGMYHRLHPYLQEDGEDSQGQDFA